MNPKHAGIETADTLIRSFVPLALQYQYAVSPGKIKTGQPEYDQVILLWIDVASFTPLCKRLMSDPVNGVEKITSILRHHYNRVLATVAEHGGEPLFFAGDGVMIAWPEERFERKNAAQLALSCAQTIIAGRTTVDDKGDLLSLHLIVSAGPWQMSKLESAHEKLMVSFFGEAFTDLSLSSKIKAPNRVILSNNLAEFLPDTLTTEPLGNYATVITGIIDIPKLPVAGLPAISDNNLAEMQLFIPRTLSFPLNEEHLKWKAEIRPVTIVFVRLPNNGNSPEENLQRLKRFAGLATPLVTKYDGLLNQLWMDEKESNMLICFGPPPSAHFDNADRAVRMGFEIHHLLKRSGIQNSIGISSGMAYCGIIGNNLLRQYTVIGDVVNLAAHIAGIKRNEIFCDKATYIIANKSVNFGGQVMAAVKGRTEPVSLFVPKGFFVREAETSASYRSFGRQQEIDQLKQVFENVKLGQSEFVIVEGEIGMGKSKIIEEFLLGIAEHEALRLSGISDVVSFNTPYASLRPVILAILGIGPDQLVSGDQLHELLVAKIGERASLLNIVLNADLPDSTSIIKMTGAQRVQATHELLLEILAEQCSLQPLILVFDDARWMDEFTLRILRSVKQDFGNCMMILAYDVTEGLQQVHDLKESGAGVVIMKPLADNDIRDLICEQLGVASISDSMADVVLRLSRGNPFFCIELAGSLLNNELLLFDNNSCSLIETADIKKFSLPETVQGAVRNRIDRLGVGSQISLKVGSVIGKRFLKEVVCDVYPIGNEKHLVPGYLSEVENNGLLNAILYENRSGYLFNSVTILDVAYEMTLAEHRRQIHRDIALWHENNFSDNIQVYNLQIANHWLHAGEKQHAVSYFEKEAFRLFRLGYVREALDIGLEGLRQLDYELPRDVPTIGAQIGESMGAIHGMMAGRGVAELIHHHRLEDANIGKLIRLIMSLAPLAFQSRQNELFALMTINSLRLTLEHGNGESAAEVYAMYAVIYKVLTGDTEQAFTWSNLSLEVDSINGNSLQSRVFFVHCWFIGIWKRPVSELIPLATSGIRSGFASGDIIYACFNLSLEVILHGVQGARLSAVESLAKHNMSKNADAVLNAVFHLRHEKQFARALQGLTDSPTSFSEPGISEETDIASICETDLFNQIAYYYVSKLKLHVHFGNWSEALDWGERSYQLLPAFASQPAHMELEQYFTMALLCRSAALDENDREQYVLRINTGIKNLSDFADLCPENFLHKYQLVAAMHEALHGSSTAAIMQFETAASQAEKAGYTQDAALAYEHLARMKRRVGMDYSAALESALNWFHNWDAHAKLAYLLKEFDNS